MRHITHCYYTMPFIHPAVWKPGCVTEGLDLHPIITQCFPLATSFRASGSGQAPDRCAGLAGNYQSKVFFEQKDSGAGVALARPTPRPPAPAPAPPPTARGAAAALGLRRQGVSRLRTRRTTREVQPSSRRGARRGGGGSDVSSPLVDVLTSQQDGGPGRA